MNDTVTKTIGKVQVTWNGRTFLYNTPMEMSGQGLDSWKKRNAKALKALKLEVPAVTVIDKVVVERKILTPNLTYTLPQGMTGRAFTDWKTRNDEALSHFKSIVR